MLARRAAFAATLAALCLFADPAQNMSGTWKLNLARSSWGKRDKPTAIELKVEHDDPSIKYTGVALNADATDKRTFSFSGAIDDKAYPAEGADGAGTISIHRVNATTTIWTYKSNDGKVNESATTTISGDGKHLTRRINRTGPTGKFTWTEVYDKTS